jgi:AAA domain-containing protein
MTTDQAEADGLVQITVFNGLTDIDGRQRSTTWQRISATLTNHKTGPRDGSLFSCATFQGTRKRANVAARFLYCLDIEASKKTGEIPPAPMDIVKRLVGLGWTGIVYTTWNHTAEMPRFRVVLLIERPIAFKSVADVESDADVSRGLARALGLEGVIDTTKCAAESIFFLPRHGDGRPFFAEAVPGRALTPGDLDRARADGIDHRFGEEKAEAANIAATNSTTTSHASVVDAFNVKTPIEELLVRYGYKRQSAQSPNWRSTYQRSESYATRVYPSGRWISLSMSDIEAGLGRVAPGNAATSGDAFDLRCPYEHNGDFAAAVKTIAGELGIERPKPEAEPWQDDGSDDFDADDFPLGAGPADEPADVHDEERAKWDDASFGEEEKPKATIRASPFVWIPEAQIPKRDFLYGTHLIRGFISTTLAPGGLGKSTLIMSEAVDMATAGATLGIARRPLRVWTVNGEDPRDEIMRKLLAVMKFYSIEPDMVADRLFVNSGRDNEFLIAKENRGGMTIMQRNVDAMIEEIRANRFDVVQIDPVVSIHQVSENDNTKIDAVLRQLARIAEVTGCAIELVHHVRKPGGAADKTTVDDARGASSFLNRTRSARVLNRAGEQDAATLSQRGETFKPWQFFRVDDGKSSLAPPGEVADWYHLRSVQLSNGDNVGIVERAAVISAFEGVTTAHLRAVQDRLAGKAGGCAENIRAADWVGYLVAEVLGLNLDDATERLRVHSIIRTWIQNRALVVRVEPRAKDGRPQKRVFVGQLAT